MTYMLVIFVCDMFEGSRERKAMMFGKGLTWLQLNLVIALSSSSLSLSSTLTICKCLSILICADVLRMLLLDVSLCGAWMVSRKTLLMSLVRFLGTLADEIEMGGPWTGCID